MNCAPSPTEKHLRRAAWLAIALLVALLGWQCRHGLPVTSDLMALAPRTTSDPLRTLAQKRVDLPLSRQVVVLVGHSDRKQAVALAESVTNRLSGSRRFDDVRLRVHVDLSAVRQSLLAARLAMLPAADRRQLANDPAAYAARRAAEMANPFGSAGVGGQKE